MRSRLSRRIAAFSNFGGQRSIQLSYGRLWASIDQTPASGNALDIAGYCSIGLCVKAPSAKVGRSNRLGRVAGALFDGPCARRYLAKVCRPDDIIEWPRHACGSADDLPAHCHFVESYRESACTFARRPAGCGSDPLARAALIGCNARDWGIESCTEPP